MTLWGEGGAGAPGGEWNLSVPRTGSYGVPATCWVLVEQAGQVQVYGHEAETCPESWWPRTSQPNTGHPVVMT